MSPTKSLNIGYDQDHDILNVLLANIDECTENIDIDADVVIRLDYKTKKVVGFIIDDFSKLFPNWKDLREWELTEKFGTLIEGLNNLHLTPAADKAA